MAMLHGISSQQTVNGLVYIAYVIYHIALIHRFSTDWYKALYNHSDTPEHMWHVACCRIGTANPHVGNETSKNRQTQSSKMCEFLKR